MNLNAARGDQRCDCASQRECPCRIADALGLSERTLSRKFQELTHEPPQSFIMRRHVEHARTLLESTLQPIKTIARAAGYEYESSFREAFRKLTLMSPQAYRARRMERAV
ncbi:helix-turn-helix domain-containing protein [Bradyrhizobium diversitatis]|uniref:helix-turn-helix domain-containing protein n=1 Tax=Bradyrhizobium diversitatis TaxID=2755406 RepID=UPI001FE48A2E|nr:helix-turn-helix domain-containing protein [Bradyrhizobium diversitatis]